MKSLRVRSLFCLYLLQGVMTKTMFHSMCGIFPVNYFFYCNFYVQKYGKLTVVFLKRSKCIDRTFIEKLENLTRRVSQSVILTELLIAKVDKVLPFSLLALFPLAFPNLKMRTIDKLRRWQEMFDGSKCNAHNKAPVFKSRRNASNEINHMPLSF